MVSSEDTENDNDISQEAKRSSYQTLPVLLFSITTTSIQLIAKPNASVQSVDRLEQEAYK